MNHSDHVRLLERGVQAASQERYAVWADLGSGTGAFTLALADLLGGHGEIFSVDRDASALAIQRAEMQARFPSVVVHYLQADYVRSLALPRLDGIVMANSLHFQRQKEPIVRYLRSHLKPDGRLILVEYDVDRGNTWVPYPLSYSTWVRTAARCGFMHTELLATQPSRFLHQIYAALSW